MSSRGFTLIELVSVLVAIGVLGILALPRYIDLGDSAHSAAARATSGALQSGVNLVHSTWAARGGGNSVSTSGGSIPVNAEGLPVPASVSGAACATLWQQLLAGAPPVSTTFVVGEQGWAATPLANGCVYIFQPDNDPLRLILYPTSSGGTILGQPIVAGSVLYLEV